MVKPTSPVRKAKAYRIKVIKNGPYLVTGGVPLSEQKMGVDSEGQCRGWVEVKKYDQEGDYTLCRCGQSRNKPFCDDAHIAIQFDGTEEADRRPYLKRAISTEGPDLTLTDVDDLCAGARFCHRAGGTWDLTEGSDDPQARQMAIEEACECPSGRIVAWDRNGEAIEPELEPSIGLVEDAQLRRLGPIWVRGGIPIEAEDGTTYEVRNRVTLCRCGRSANKPFCDGSHIHVR
jgi:CDGSH-type Zn-finger protein